MEFCTDYKGLLYSAVAGDVSAAKNELEELIGRPLPNGTEIINLNTNETSIVEWGKRA
jgi:hypothetical protein